MSVYYVLANGFALFVLIASLAAAGCRDVDLTRPSVTAGRLPPGAVPIPPPGPDDPVLAVCPSGAEIAALGLEIAFAPDIQNAALTCRAAEGSVDLTQRQQFVYAAVMAMGKLRFTRPLPWTHLSLWEWFSALRPRISVKS